MTDVIQSCLLEASINNAVKEIISLLCGSVAARYQMYYIFLCSFILFYCQPFPVAEL